MQSVGVPETSNWIRLALLKTFSTVLDELILVLEPHFSVLIVKVFTHRKCYVISTERRAHVLYNGYELVNLNGIDFECYVQVRANA